MCVCVCVCVLNFSLLFLHSSIMLKSFPLIQNPIHSLLSPRWTFTSSAHSLRLSPFTLVYTFPLFSNTAPSTKVPILSLLIYISLHFLTLFLSSFPFLLFPFNHTPHPSFSYSFSQHIHHFSSFTLISPPLSPTLQSVSSSPPPTLPPFLLLSKTFISLLPISLTHSHISYLLHYSSIFPLLFNIAIYLFFPPPNLNTLHPSLPHKHINLSAPQHPPYLFYSNLFTFPIKFFFHLPLSFSIIQTFTASANHYIKFQKCFAIILLYFQLHLFRIA